MRRAGVDVEALYRSYGHSVLRRARQILDSEDEATEVLQELFAGLIARPHQFDGRSAPSTFQYAATTHACLTRLRNRRNRHRLLNEQVRPWVCVGLAPPAVFAHTKPNSPRPCS
jgi:RNA polymerase sigma-70 factor (ECF subfamily)